MLSRKTLYSRAFSFALSAKGLAIRSFWGSEHVRDPPPNWAARSGCGSRNVWAVACTAKRAEVKAMIRTTARVFATFPPLLFLNSLESEETYRAPNRHTRMVFFLL